MITLHVYIDLLYIYVYGRSTNNFCGWLTMCGHLPWSFLSRTLTMSFLLREISELSEPL